MRWTDEAAQRLREIYDYLLERNPEVAARTVRALYELAGSLDRFPERGFRHRTRSGRDVRVVLYGHFRVVYRIEQADTVIVVGIFHGSMDLARYLP